MIAAAGNDCEAYGYRYGSPEYSQCMMTKDGQYQQMEMQRRANIQRGLANMQQSIQAPQPQIVPQEPVRLPPRTCTSSTFGNQTTTNCQ